MKLSDVVGLTSASLFPCPHCIYIYINIPQSITLLCMSDNIQHQRLADNRVYHVKEMSYFTLCLYFLYFSTDEYCAFVSRHVYMLENRIYEYLYEHYDSPLLFMNMFTRKQTGTDMKT